MYPGQQRTNITHDAAAAAAVEEQHMLHLHVAHLTLLLVLTAHASSFRTLSSPAHVTRYNTCLCWLTPLLE
jgi:hypothetical protein